MISADLTGAIRLGHDGKTNEHASDLLSDGSLAIRQLAHASHHDLGRSMPVGPVQTARVDVVQQVHLRGVELPSELLELGDACDRIAGVGRFDPGLEQRTDTSGHGIHSLRQILIQHRRSHEPSMTKGCDNRSPVGPEFVPCRFVRIWTPNLSAGGKVAMRNRTLLTMRQRRENFKQGDRTAEQVALAVDTSGGHHR